MAVPSHRSAEQHPTTRQDLAALGTFSGVIPPSADDVSLRLTGLIGAAGTISDAHSHGEVRPPVVPGYQILREVGRGGMGVVYEARHLALDRQVALKVILGGVHADADTLARFRSEAAAIARLTHPSIVQIYEVGEHQGLPYAALEYVVGGSLDRELRHEPQPPALAAEWVRTLALALQAAHDAGILHRDLKPANVLLAPVSRTSMGSGTNSSPSTAWRLHRFQPKIADFGLAKRLDGPDPGHTRTGVVVGTPGYMAPEQASGKQQQVGPAADQYALGAILYEMLTGRPPFQGLTPMETLMLAQTGEPVPPTRLQPAIPKDLETICLKALSREPDRRYTSSAALAEDLRRYLHSEPILARPAGMLERGTKWARRRPAAAVAVAAGVLLALLTAGAAVLLAWAWRGESLARQQVQKERDEAVKQKQRADANYKLAFQALDLTAQKIVENPRLQEADGIELRKELLGLTLPVFRQIVAQQPGDSELNLQRAHAAGRLASTQMELFELKEAEQSARQQVEILHQLRQQDSANAQYRQQLAGAVQNLAFVMGLAERREEEAKLLHESEALWHEAVRAEPNDAAAHLGYASVVYNRGKRANDRGQYDEAGQLYSEAIASLKVAIRLEPNDADAHNRYGMALTNLSLIRRYQNRLEEAGQLLEEARTLKQKLVQQHPRHHHYQHIYAVCLYNLGQVRAEEKRFKEAEGHFREALRVMEKLAQAQASIPRFWFTLATLQQGVGCYLDQMGKSDDGELALQAGVTNAERLVQQYPERLEYAELHQSLYESLAKRQKTLTRPLEQLKWFRKRQEVLRAALVRFPQADSRLRRLLAQAYADEGLLLEAEGVNRPQEALAAFDVAIAEYRHLLELQPSDIGLQIEMGGVHVNRSLVFTSITHENEKALPDLTEARKYLEAALAKEPKNSTARLFLINALQTEGAARDRLSQFEPATQVWQRLVDVNQDASRELHWLVKLGFARLRAGQAEGWKPTERWEANINLPASALLDLAKLHALAAGLPTVADSEREERRQHALRLLRRAFRLGGERTEQARQELAAGSDWAALRGWPPFHEWLRELSAKP